MRVFRSREVAVAVAGLSLAVALSVTATLLTPPSEDGLSAGSSFSKAPAGTAAIYLTLGSLGYDVRRSFDPAASLKVEPASTVLILADPLEDASTADRRAIQALISAGMTVVATGCHAGSFFTSRSSFDSQTGGPRTFPAVLPSPLVAGAPHIVMEPRCLPPDLPAQFVPLYADRQAEVVRAARVGRGLAVWWAANTPIANTSVDSPGHLELLLNAIGEAPRTVLWDEFYHGQRRSLYSYARSTPLPWAFAQIALIAAVAAAMYVRRRAPIRELPVEPRVSPLEFVDTMGGLYARADTAADAVATARGRLRRLLSDATGLSPAAGDDRLAAAAAGRTRLDPADLSDALNEAARHSQAGAVTVDRALPLVRRLQALAAAVERTGG